MTETLPTFDASSLEAKGLVISYEDKWVGEVPRQPVKQLDRVRGIHIPLTPAEWCALCMREGDYYIGGCCGQTGYIQDCFNSLFRNSGYAEARELLELAACCENHEGFELYHQDLTEEQFNQRVDKWDKLGPIEKIGLCYRAVAAKLHEPQINVPHKANSLDSPAEIFYALERNIQFFAFKDVFTDDSSPAKTNGQEHGNIQLRLARLLPAFVKLQGAITTLAKPFSGFGIFQTSNGNLCRNGYGDCIYYTEQDAQNVIDAWKKSNSRLEDDNRDPKNIVSENDWVIKPVVVTVETGLVATEK